jgi:hypothetical protein
MMQMLAVFGGELARARRQMTNVVDRGHERPAKRRVPFRRAGDDRIGDARDQSAQLRQRGNGKPRHGVASHPRGVREISRCWTLPDVIENDGAQPVERLRRLFGE